jgi:hypothetical protein
LDFFQPDARFVFALVFRKEPFSPISGYGSRICQRSEYAVLEAKTKGQPSQAALGFQIVKIYDKCRPAVVGALVSIVSRRELINDGRAGLADDFVLGIRATRATDCADDRALLD